MFSRDLEDNVFLFFCFCSVVDSMKSVLKSNGKDVVEKDEGAPEVVEHNFLARGESTQ